MNGLMYTGSFHQLWEQFRAAVFVIFWSALVTFILMKLIGLVLRGARYKDDILEIGDLAIHDEEAFPDETFADAGGGGPGAGAFALAGLDVRVAVTTRSAGSVATTRVNGPRATRTKGAQS